MKKKIFARTELEWCLPCYVCVVADIVAGHGTAGCWSDPWLRRLWLVTSDVTLPLCWDGLSQPATPGTTTSGGGGPSKTTRTTMNTTTPTPPQHHHNTNTTTPQHHHQNTTMSSTHHQNITSIITTSQPRHHNSTTSPKDHHKTTFKSSQQHNNITNMTDQLTLHNIILTCRFPHTNLLQSPSEVLLYLHHTNSSLCIGDSGCYRYNQPFLFYFFLRIIFIVLLIHEEIKGYRNIC